MISTSNKIDFLYIYSCSNFTLSAIEIPSLPLICGHPAIPGFKLSTPAATRKANKST